MFGLRIIRNRLTMLECRKTPEIPEPTIEIPVVDAKGKTVNAYYYGYPLPKTHTLTVREAFNELQKALGVEIQLVKGVSDTVKVNKVKRGK